MDHALACVLGLLGRGIAEACNINIEDLSTERGHRTVTVLGKGSKLAVIPLPPRVGRAMDGAAGDRTSGPLLLTRHGNRMNRHAATRIVRRLASRAGVTKHISPHSLRHSFITAAQLGTVASGASFDVVEYRVGIRDKGLRTAA